MPRRFSFDSTSSERSWTFGRTESEEGFNRVTGRTADVARSRKTVNQLLRELEQEDEERQREEQEQREREEAHEREREEEERQRDNRRFGVHSDNKDSMNVNMAAGSVLERYGYFSHDWRIQNRLRNDQEREEEEERERQREQEEREREREREQRDRRREEEERELYGRSYYYTEDSDLEAWHARRNR
ncbi:hypothetical protein PT974_03844 [Cladobotryum mycophilum]|uniref:Uncharacterized protein n=1 Tax=Cladobotryum mycophilum TaxID=491253 RepID=A0ABR0STF9_9HYPO